MNIVLWVIQGLLAALFLLTGFLKVSQPKEQLLTRMHALEDLSPATIKAIGTLEIMATLGLILPQLTSILPWLTPVAAIGCALLMIGATITHIRRNEKSFIVTVVFLLLALFVAYGRFVLVPA